MIDRTKTFKRLGIVGAAAAVGLVPLSVLATPAFATVTNASLTVNPTTTGSTSQVVDSFTTGTNLPTNGTITISSNASSGCVVGLPAATTAAALGTTAAPANYTVTFTPSGGTATPETGTVKTNGTAPTCSTTGSTAYQATNTGATITVGTPIPAGSAVTITVNNAQNPPTPSGVYFADSTSTDTQVINTGVVSIGNAVVSVPGVTSVNPTAYTNAGGEPFTVTGSNFNDLGTTSSTGTYTPGTPPSPVVCFVESDVTVPAASTTNPCVSPASAPGTVMPAKVTAVSPGEIQGQSPVLNTGKSYNVVVYNYNPGATTPTYTAASGINSQTLVGVASGLNVVPEAGVRVVDSRAGLNLPKGALATGTPIAIPLSDFNQSLTLPTNLPTNYSGLDVNVTAVAPASGGNIQMWTVASGKTCSNGLTAPIKPATVNFQPPQDTNNSQMIAVSDTAGSLCVQDNGAAVSLVVDVVGYTTSTTATATDTSTTPPTVTTTSAAAYTPVNSRVLDTRPASQVGSLQGPLQSNTVYRALVCSAGNCPTGPVAFNVAAVAPSAPGNLRAFPEPASGAPAPSAVPNTAVDNYIVNTDSSAMLITNVTPDASGNGYIDLYSAMSGAGTVNVVIDELGAFAAPGSTSTAGTVTTVTTGSSIHPVAEPYRIYDSRPGPIPAAGTVTVVGAPTGSGTNFTPATALGLVGNLSDINPAGQGYLVTFPAGGAVPGTASIANFPAQTRNTNNMVALNPTNRSFSIYAGGAATNTTYDASAWIG